MSEKGKTTSQGVGRGVSDASERVVSPLVIAVAIMGNVVLALGAFWLSFTTLRDLAYMSGVPVGQSWVWPVIVDGVIIEATISVVALPGTARSARRFSWFLLAIGTLVSVAANITHAALATTQAPTPVAAVVASVPPLVLLAMTHLTVELSRHAQPHRPGAPANRGTTAPLTTPALPLPHPAKARVMKASARPRTGGDVLGRSRASELAAQGESNRAIAAALNVHPTTVGRWLSAPDAGMPALEGTNNDHK